MKAQELRIGNYVNGIYETEIDRGNGIIEDVESCEVVKVVGLDSVGFSDYSIWIEDGSREYYNSFEPIPLTEEWLLKFGFKSDEDFGNWHLNDYEIFLSGHTYFLAATKEGVVYWYNYASDDYYSSVRKIKFVHQLQNLYFALTNEELKLSK
jgi:hypothetical protein